jgi:hypothetical protein
MRTRTRWPLPSYRVRIAAHTIPPRWFIPAQTLDLPAGTVEAACSTAVRWAHSDAGVPCWKPCVRRSLTFTTAEALSATTEDQTVQATPLLPAQLPLWTDRMAA